jgi:hypothetical protein
MPKSDSAACGAKRRRVNRNDCGQPAFPVAELVDRLMIIKIRQVPGSGHSISSNLIVMISNYIAQLAEAQGERSLKLGRLTGSEPATSGTTNQRSNQLSYSRHTP